MPSCKDLQAEDTMAPGPDDPEQAIETPASMPPMVIAVLFHRKTRKRHVNASVRK